MFHQQPIETSFLDQGGGIPRHITDQTFHYLVSTAPRPSFDNPAKAPLAGYGGSARKLCDEDKSVNKDTK